MTLKDLFDKITYDEAYPYLLPLITGHQGNAQNFRETCDLIRSNEPQKGLADEVYIPDRGAEYKEQRYIVRFVDGAPWSNELAKTIVYENAGEYNEPQVLATRLSEMTYHSFSQDEYTEEGDEPGLFWEPEVPPLKAAERIDQQWCGNWGVRINRSKRKRLYRQKSTANRFHKTAMREQLLKRMEIAFPREEIIQLMLPISGFMYPLKSTFRKSSGLPFNIRSRISSVCRSGLVSSRKRPLPKRLEGPVGSQAIMCLESITNFIMINNDERKGQICIPECMVQSE